MQGTWAVYEQPKCIRTAKAESENKHRDQGACWCRKIGNRKGIRGGHEERQSTQYYSRKGMSSRTRETKEEYEENTGSHARSDDV